MSLWRVALVFSVVFMLCCIWCWVCGVCFELGLSFPQVWLVCSRLVIWCGMCFGFRGVCVVSGFGFCGLFGFVGFWRGGRLRFVSG